MAYIMAYPSHNSLPSVNNHEEVNQHPRPNFLQPRRLSRFNEFRDDYDYDRPPMTSSSSNPRGHINQEFVPVYPHFFPPGAQPPMPSRLVFPTPPSSSYEPRRSNTLPAGDYFTTPHHPQQPSPLSGLVPAYPTSSSSSSRSESSRLRTRSQVNRPPPVTLPDPASLVPKGPSSHDSYFASPPPPSSRPQPALVRSGSSDSGTYREQEGLDIYAPVGANMPRGVRWTEDLVCPTPPPKFPRRKGFFNARGDQLWTNDGRYKPSAEPYPADLCDYPQPGEGWSNEFGIVIDMKHRMLPKASVKPVLKRAK